MLVVADVTYLVHVKSTVNTVYSLGSMILFFQLLLARSWELILMVKPIFEETYSRGLRLWKGVLFSH